MNEELDPAYQNEDYTNLQTGIDKNNPIYKDCEGDFPHYSQNETDNLPVTAVLNIDADQMVLLPLDHALISVGVSAEGFVELIKDRLPEELKHLVVSGKIVPDDTDSDLNILKINDENYSALAVALKLDGLGDEAGEDLFVQRCREAVGYNGCDMIQKEGYQFVFKMLREKHLSLEHILSNIPKYTDGLVETTADNVLAELAGNYDQTSKADRLMAAIKTLTEDYKTTYLTSYQANGHEVLLYRQLVVLAHQREKYKQTNKIGGVQ
jgi:hypothetical protein